jgi:hypothetical protein
MSYPIWTVAQIEAFGKQHNNTEIEVAYETGPAKDRQSLYFHGTISRPSNTWIITRREKTINLQGTDIDVYDLTPYVRGQSTERPAARDDVVEASKKATRGEATDRTRAKKPTEMSAAAPPLEAVNDSDEDLEARREADRTRKVDERRRVANDDRRAADERQSALDRREAALDELQRQRDEINKQREELARERHADIQAARAHALSAQAFATAQIQATTASGGNRPPTTGDDVSFVNAFTRADVEKAMKALGAEHNGVYKVVIDKELWVIVRIEDQTIAMFCPIHIMLEIPRHEPITRRPHDTIKADIAENHKALTAKVDLRMAELGAGKPTQHEVVQYVANRSAFKMAMAEYTKALTEFANDTKTALPTSRKGWKNVLEAAVKALRAYRDVTVGHTIGKFVSFNWNYAFYQEHFNVVQLLSTKLPKVPD